MAGISTGTGLASGIDYSTMISQLMQIEAQPQVLLTKQLSATRDDAAAYREINTAFAAMGSAAEALTKPATWGAAKATSSDSAVTATATSSATPGSLTFTVDRLAAAHSVMATRTWTNSTDDFGLGSKLTIKSTDGNTTFGTIAITSSDSGAASLDDAVAAINKSGLGLTAAAIKTSSGYALQVTSTATGATKAFQVQSDTDATGSSYAVATKGIDAQISFTNPSSTTPYTSTSATNTFDGVLTGTSFTVGKPGVTATITVATDPDAITSAVQSLVTAANGLLQKIYDNTDSTIGSKARLKGNWSMNSMAGQVLTAVSSAVGGTVPAGATSAIGGTSAGAAGLQLTNDGLLDFKAATFRTKLAADPSLVQKLFGGSTGVGTDNIANTPDDTVAVDGIGARLKVLAERASDSVGGTLTQLANGQQARADDLQDQIDAWGLRLAARKATLTAQFNAMETALGKLQNQSSWLSSQLSSLPSWSSSKS
jgi:flagellar hook-associated protein 2